MAMMNAFNNATFDALGSSVFGPGSQASPFSETENGDLHDDADAADDHPLKWRAESSLELQDKTSAKRPKSNHVLLIEFLLRNALLPALAHRAVSEAAKDILADAGSAGRAVENFADQASEKWGIHQWLQCHAAISDWLQSISHT